MAEGLSERDRRRLEEGRAYAAKVMAEERERLAEKAQRDAERAAQAEQVRSERAARFGPKEVVGPDGNTVRLRARPSGPLPDGPDLSGAGGDLIGLLIAIPLYIMGMLVILLINRLVFWGGWTVDVEVVDGKKTKLRFRSEDAAVQRLHELAEAVRLEGLAAVNLTSGVDRTG